MSGAVKKCTQLTGLAVSKHPHRVLTQLYNKILRSLENIPKEAAYRQHTSKLVQERLALVTSEPDVAKLEEKINGGQVEELILQAEKELMLTRKMITWKPWQNLETEVPANQWKWPM
ncbi:NADH dehydrogenase [ubiquinone] 1 alpha subcomplex subunit 5-like [Parasteatoda tepidariorum]|uniref:NADH dehydrogenase [ubiquinone] 1 alpha subcomplex subunit 5-like n=1 Tax=Parasteatoda tepidariorum TaxID=114398 RepID=UPI00077FAF2B|nr:NADH dehydrogenase [ubiquinone] 1 alpha subcomplex subunit 5-like [Parasteatoda tepidariorum]XP_042900087.1 NADH dehydrogenase [ubiquinone] 1 alpha subcomplex subunit 5-like [Parasteatoda tepidariorum]